MNNEFVYKIRELGTFNPEYPPDHSPHWISPGMDNYCGMVLYCTDGPDEHQRLKLIDNLLSADCGWWYHLSWVIKGTLDPITNEFIPCPDEDQVLQPQPFTDRSQWKPDQPKQITIHKKVVDIIEEIVNIPTNVSDITSDNFYIINFKEDTTYPFTWIKISETNKKKLSGIAFNVIEASAWEQCTYKYETALDSYFKDYTLKVSPSQSHRAAKGTFLKPAKLLRALYPDLSDSEITSHASKLSYKLRLLANPNTSVVKVSTTPSEIYIMESCFESCMRDQPQSWFQIYDDLPHTSIAYIEEDGILKARALIHDQVFDNNKVHYRDSTQGSYETLRIMDRIYAEDDDYEVLMIQWAKENGYWYKERQSASVDYYIKPDGQKVYLHDIYILCGDLAAEGYEGVPYIDTFCRYSADYKIMTRFNCDTNTSFSNTDGTDTQRILVRTDYSFCSRCGDKCYNEDLYLVYSSTFEEIYVCSYCRRSYYHYCDQCDEYHHTFNFNSSTESCTCCIPAKPTVEVQEVEERIQVILEPTRRRWQIIADEIATEILSEAVLPSLAAEVAETIVVQYQQQGE